MKLQNVQAWRTNYKLKSASSVCTILPQTLHESGISVETICIQVIQRRNVHATVDHGTYSMCNIRGWDCSVLSTSNRLAHRGVTYASSPLEFHGPPGQKMIYSHSGLSISMRIYWRVNFLLLCTQEWSLPLKSQKNIAHRRHRYIFLDCKNQDYNTSQVSSSQDPLVLAASKMQFLGSTLWCHQTWQDGKSPINGSS